MLTGRTRHSRKLKRKNKGIRNIKGQYRTNVSQYCQLSVLYLGRFEKMYMSYLEQVRLGVKEETGPELNL